MTVKVSGVPCARESCVAAMSEVARSAERGDAPLQCKPVQPTLRRGGTCGRRRRSHDATVSALTLACTQPAARSACARCASRASWWGSATPVQSMRPRATMRASWRSIAGQISIGCDSHAGTPMVTSLRYLRMRCCSCLTRLGYRARAPGDLAEADDLHEQERQGREERHAELEDTYVKLHRRPR